MNWLLLSRLLGLLGMLVGAAMAFCLPWSFEICNGRGFESDGFWGTLAAMVCSLASGGLLYWLGRHERSGILRKEALAIVGLGWILAGLLGSLPFLFSGTMRTAEQPMTVVDAVFESISGFTTTGASVITELEDSTQIPRSVLFWRSFTHWLGGMGIIVLFVAILGQLGAGGKALMRREVPGPVTETVRPRVQETAVAMWIIYMVISGLLTVLLMVEGMSLYDGLCHTFGTVATGGFSTRNASVRAFNDPVLEGTIIVFMLIAGTNFSLYYMVLRYQPPPGKKHVWNRLTPLVADLEFRVYLLIVVAATVALSINVWWIELYPTVMSCLRHTSFQVVTIMTTTGFGTEDFTRWSNFSQALLLLLMFIGGCAGSTGGGLKVIRYIIFVKAIRIEVERAYRPNVVRPLRLAGVTVDKIRVHEVMVYFALMLFIFISSWMTLVAIEPDTMWQGARSDKLVDCASAVAATLNNIGPGVGVLGPHSNYADFSGQGKLLMTVLMLLGRLELFAILVLFKRSFWRSQ